MTYSDILINKLSDVYVNAINDGKLLDSEQKSIIRFFQGLENR